MIEVQTLTKKYDSFSAVKDVSFTVKEGETLVLLGTSGCGKTTTLKMINRLIEPTAGVVYINKEDTRTIQPEILRRGIGYVIQNIGLFPHYTIEQNIAVVPSLLQWDKNRIHKRCGELLDLMGLDPDTFADKYPQQLSGGQKQRVGIARALAADPPLVLLDEPFGALDPITRREIQKEFKGLETLLNKTMILVTHDVFEAVDLADRICLMDAGKVQQIGTPKELIFSATNSFVETFFKAGRFQLELMVISVKDILKNIPASEAPQKEVPEFDSHQSIYEILEKMEKQSQRESSLVITDKDENKRIFTTAEEILNTFYKVKSTL